MRNTRPDYPDRRVVVTGMGIATPIGQTLVEYFDALVAGRSGIKPWKRMDERSYAKFGGDMSDFDLEQHLERVGAHYPQELIQSAKKLLRPAPRSAHITAAAALQAFVDAGFDAAVPVPERCGHVLAGHNLNANYIFENMQTYRDEPDFIEPLYGVLMWDTAVLTVISELLDLRGPTFTVGNACASGNIALLSGLDLIRSGRADVVVVSGGAFEPDPVILQGFVMIEALSYKSFNDDPTRASRPFDARREGFVAGVGAGAVVLEPMERARARGAQMYAELLGAAMTSDASRLPKPNLEGQARAMQAALKDAQVEPQRIDYISSHGTSTPVGDAVEVASIKTVFGDRAYQIPVNSTKSMIGHCLSSAAVIDFVTTVLQMKYGVVHPTINQEEKDPACDLDFVPNEARQHHIDVAISNGFGFGGLNSCVVVGRAL